MRWSSTYVLSSLFALGLAGCGGAGAESQGCHVTVDGNTSARFDVDGCATLKTGSGDAGAADVVLAFDTRTTSFGRIIASFDLGPSPAAGEIGSASSVDWSALAVSATTSCSFGGGRT